MSVASSISGQSLSGETRVQENEEAAMHEGRSMNSSKIISGTSEILSLLGTFGEGYRLSCLYRCQVCTALGVLLRSRTFSRFRNWVILSSFLNQVLTLQDALDVYLKLPAKHYNTGWVLSQVTDMNHEH